LAKRAIFKVSKIKKEIFGEKHLEYNKSIENICRIFEIENAFI
jgi:hypothetical protein